MALSYDHIALGRLKQLNKFPKTTKWNLGNLGDTQGTNPVKVQ